MLETSTIAVDFLGVVLSSWLAVYLLARGFSSRVTLRAAGVLITLAAAFLISFVSLSRPVPGGSRLWAACLTIALAIWYDLTYQWLPAYSRGRTRSIAWLIYILALGKVAVLVGLPGFLHEGEDFALWLTPAWTVTDRNAPLAVADAFFLTLTVWAILYNFHLSARAGSAPHTRSAWVASLLAAGAVGYGAVAIAAGTRMPAVGQSALLAGAVVALGYAVARHQALVERQTTLADLSLSGVAVLGLSGVYAGVAWAAGLSAVPVAVMALLAVLTHSAYDLVREFLDEVLHRRANAFRRQLRGLVRDVGSESQLSAHLQQGLSQLCGTLGATGGFIATRQAQGLVVLVSQRSLAAGSLVEGGSETADGVYRSAGPLSGQVAWLAPAYAGRDCVAVVGLGPRARQGDYVEADLDLLTEAADWVGRMVVLDARQVENRQQLLALAGEVHSSELSLQGNAADLLTTLEASPDPRFVRAVEDGLRRLADYAALGSSELAAALNAPGPTSVERGKAVRQQLVQAIEALRPAGPRPGGILPREWHGYAILYDAYVEDVPNREIMARLYISEGTFNRHRRRSLQAVARALLEMRTGPVA